jgi:uncharacterized membrane protein YqgA involved in biofilm formation
MQQNKGIRQPGNAIVILFICTISIGIVVGVWYWYDSMISKIEKDIHNNHTDTKIIHYEKTSYLWHISI